MKSIIQIREEIFRNQGKILSEDLKVLHQKYVTGEFKTAQEILDEVIENETR